MFSNCYDENSRTGAINRKYQEILRLDTMLTEADIPHTLDTIFDGWQICYPTSYASGECVMDAVEHYGSYGSYQDKLEIMGLLTPDESKYDSVLGNLTAEEVFRRIYEHHSHIEDAKLPHTRIDPILNDHVDEIIEDFHRLVEKAKSYGLDIKLTPNSTASLELYFHDDYPYTILVDKSVSGR